MKIIETIDSHTEGEPTRIILSGGPDVLMGTAAEIRAHLARDHDSFRSCVVNEPRGFDAVVGGLWIPTPDAEILGQIVFFNNVGYLGMCVHATIGLGATLVHQGVIGPGRYPIETPVGRVTIEIGKSDLIGVENVESFRYRSQVVVQTENHGEVIGDIAWGGNWFFVMSHPTSPFVPAQIPQLTALTRDVRDSLIRLGISAEDGAEIDHIEVVGTSSRADADSKNFVMCPGEAYDRSPCGTGTSAKIACLAADGLLQPGEIWRQESIVGTRFEGTFVPSGRGVIPTIRGRAFITAESRLLVDPRDDWAGGDLS